MLFVVDGLCNLHLREQQRPQRTSLTMAAAQLAEAQLLVIKNIIFPYFKPITIQQISYLAWEVDVHFLLCKMHTKQNAPFIQLFPPSNHPFCSGNQFETWHAWGRELAFWSYHSAYIHTYLSTYTHTYLHTHILIYIHTHVYTYLLRSCMVKADNTYHK